MKNLLIYTVMVILLSGCGSIFRMQEDSEILPNGATVVERGFGLPEHFGNFKLEIKRRTSNFGNSDFFYLRAERSGQERLPVTALLISVDGKVYQVSPANSREDADEGIVAVVERDSRRYFTRQVETFIISPNLMSIMLGAKESIVVTLVGENLHYGANLYREKDIQKLLKMLQALDTSK